MTQGDDDMLVFAHLGDLHLTDAAQQNYRDLLSIAAQIEYECVSQLDFVVLPGDNADNGQPAQYALANIALRMLSMPVHAIPGDHDMEQGSLAAFRGLFGAQRLPRSLRCKRHRLLFLDCCGGGSGGPDFRLGSDQMDWLRDELQEANDAAETPVVFMHTYPADLRGEGEAASLTSLFSSHRVALVDMGHTHYNEIANDGATIYVATRSTGQIEEGPVGYSIATVDGGIVSWRFKVLEEPFPFVMITSPADYRLMRGDDQIIDDTFEVRAIAFGREPITRMECQVGNDAWIAMHRVADDNRWAAQAKASNVDRITITVRALTVNGRLITHAITAAGRAFTASYRATQGSDAASIGAWPENGLLGTQLGPNRNGRKW